VNEPRSIEYLTGFLMGSFLGIFLEGTFAAIYNLGCVWFGWARPALAWWMVVPVPLVFGLIMAKAIASYHLEDY